MGWRLTLAIAAVSALVVAGVLVVYGAGELGLRVGIRTTARLGVILFSVTFAASALNSLYRSRWSKWLLRNRRYLGVGFAAIHLQHAALIVALASAHTESFLATTSMTSIIGGSVGYLWLAAMVATSFDRTAAAIGRRAWIVLHRSGMYVIWAIFVFSYLGVSLVKPGYAVLLVLLLAAYGMRVAAALRRRRRRPALLSRAA